MIKKYLFIVAFFILYFSTNAYSRQIILSDSAQISILTSSPWEEEVYALFGHSAIRVSDKKSDIDYVFNYGVFDFNSPNFAYRFCKGETDYILNAYPFKYYLFEYDYKGVSVFEQVLNLNQEEKQKLWMSLCENALPENREYRYNFFFDNCATRIRDIIEANVDGKIEYSATNKTQSLRDLVHECVSIDPWTRFGIDLLIGSDADKDTTDREKMFLPIYMENAFAGATTTSNDGTQRQLIYESRYILTKTEATSASTPTNYPLIFTSIILLITISISILSYNKKYRFIGCIFDFVLLLLAGLIGCAIAFLAFVSVHPCTNPNWNLVWLNPIQIIIALMMLVKYFSKCVYYYHFINFALLSLFLVCWIFIPQDMEIAFIPFVASLLLRSSMNVIQYRKGAQCKN